MKSKMIQPEKNVKIFPFKFFKDDAPLDKCRNIKKKPPSDKKGKEKKGKKKDSENFREFYY